MEKQDVKKLILDYLQLHSWDLRSQIAVINELKFEDEPPRLVLCLSRKVDDLPEIKFMGQLLPVEIRITGEPVVMKQEEEQLPVPEKQPSVKNDGLFHHDIPDSNEAINPFSEINIQGKEKSVEEWKNRWPGVKINKDEK